jgi:hypothetical protein
MKQQQIQKNADVLVSSRRELDPHLLKLTCLSKRDSQLVGISSQWETPCIVSVGDTGARMKDQVWICDIEAATWEFVIPIARAGLAWSSELLATVASIGRNEDWEPSPFTPRMVLLLSTRRSALVSMRLHSCRVNEKEITIVFFGGELKCAVCVK